MNLTKIILAVCLLCLGSGCGRIFGPYITPGMTFEEVSLDELPRPMRHTLEEQYPDATIHSIRKRVFYPDIDRAPPSYRVRLQISPQEQIDRTLLIDDGTVRIFGEHGQVISEHPIQHQE